MSQPYGVWREPVQKVWWNMMDRCYNPKCRKFVHYGARGIKVCARWHDAQLFAKDMGNPLPGQTIDRINNDGDYEPGNCRWADKFEQGRNKRNNRILTFNGESLSVAEWAERTGISEQTLHGRIIRGWTTERTLTIQPIRGGWYEPRPRNSKNVHRGDQKPEVQ